MSVTVESLHSTLLRQILVMLIEKSQTTVYEFRV